MKKTFNILSLFIIIFISIFLVSCNGGSSSGEPEPVTGTNGLVLEFMRDSLLDSIYEGDSYYMQLELTNEGAADIREGILVATSIDKSFTVDNYGDFDSINLRGDDGLFHGETSIVEIILNSNELRPGITTTESTIAVKACYEYQTIFQDTICIDTDIRGTQSQKPCTPQSISGSKGQGAPIIVRSVDPRITLGNNGVKVSFEVSIGSTGSGFAMAPDNSRLACDSGATSNVVNIISISEIRLSKYSLSGGSIECDTHTLNPNEYDLKDKNRDTIRCRVVPEIPFLDGTFSTPMTITLDYAYEETTTAKVTIEKLK